MSNGSKVLIYLSLYLSASISRIVDSNPQGLISSMYYKGTFLKLWSGLCEFFLAKCSSDLTTFLTCGYSVLCIPTKTWQNSKNMVKLEKPHREWTIKFCACGCISNNLAWMCAGMGS